LGQEEIFTKDKFLTKRCSRLANRSPLTFLVEVGDEIFLKTIIPSRKAAKKYLRR